MRKILVLAYQLSPYKGSEFSVAWNYVKNMSIDNELVVIYGVSGQHMGNVREVEEYQQNTPLENVRLIPVLPTKWADRLNCLNKRGVLVYTSYWAYTLWHKEVYRIVEKLIKSEPFDLVHYVGPIGYREPGYLWKLGLPYVWGPIGGFNNVPWKMMKALPLSGKIKLGGRTLLNKIQMHTSLRVRKAIGATDILLTATTYNKDIVEKIYHKESIYLPENCISGEIRLINKQKFTSSSTELIWIGSVEARKALIILLEAISKLSDRKCLKLHVVGDGPLKNMLIKQCSLLDIETNIVWHGQVGREKVYELLTNAHLHVITSVSEGNPTTVWEAMSVGVPTMSVDHCGMHDVICKDCGIKIPVSDYEGIVQSFTDKLHDIIRHPEQLEQMAYGTIQCAEKYTWAQRRVVLNSLYTSLFN